MTRLRISRNRTKLVYVSCLLAALFAAAFFAPAAGSAAAEQGAAEAPAGESGGLPSAIRTAGLGLAAALVMGLAALATAKVQAAVGAAGTGVLAEKPDMFMTVVILIAIPETIVVLGFVVALLLYSTI